MGIDFYGMMDSGMEADREPVSIIPGEVGDDIDEEDFEFDDDDDDEEDDDEYEDDEYEEDDDEYEEDLD